jgi:tetratricopeptide (TPR) repeat protein
MLHRTPTRSRLAAALAAAFVGLAATAWAAADGDLLDAQKLHGQGRMEPALEKVDTFLRAQPRDPQGRFLRGVLLAELKRAPEAIEIFTALTEDFPELPEPYNNLAVLHASQGNYDKARTALELAVQTHPGYALAHENLGDIYAQLASRAYDRALQLDKDNATAPGKLATLKALLRPARPTPDPSTSRKNSP